MIKTVPFCLLVQNSTSQFPHRIGMKGGNILLAMLHMPLRCTPHFPHQTDERRTSSQLPAAWANYWPNLAVLEGLNVPIASSIPSDWGYWGSLERLELSGPNLYGNLPDFSSRVFGLTKLVLSATNTPGFSSAIPDTWSSLTGLQVSGMVLVSRVFAAADQYQVTGGLGLVRQ